MEKKPWYKSKITLLGIVMGVVGGTQAVFGWLTGNGVTPDQVQVITNTLPDLADSIKSSIDTQNYFAILSSLGGFITSIWRIWFTDTIISKG